jgi:hypothetical protein
MSEEDKFAMSPLEQISSLCPELQIAIKQIEDEYDKSCEDAKHRRENIIKYEKDLFKANILCNELVTNAVKQRHTSLKSLREFWGGFFYDNPR